MIAGKQALKGWYIPARYKVPGKERNVNSIINQKSSIKNQKSLNDAK
jgi:hypothetical protein